MQVLRYAQAEGVSYIERGWGLFQVSIKRVLGIALSNCARGAGAADDLAGVVNGLTPSVTCLETRTAVAGGSGERSLQGMIDGVGRCSDDVFHAESAGHIARAIERSVRREGSGGSGIGVGKTDAGKLFGCGTD